MEQVDCLEPVLGVRAWEARSDGRLYSVFLPFKWRPGVNHAHCDPEGSSCSEAHKSPQSDCACGIYAYRDLNYRDLAFYERKSIVVGTIAAWGRIEQDVGWFRAESARLLAVGASPTGGALERRAAIRYSVPLVPLDELAGFSRRHAQPASVARPMRGAVIVVLDCGPATIGCFDEIRSGCHRLIERACDWRVDVVVCGEGTFVVPLRGEGARRQSQLRAAVDFLMPDCGGPALARGVERARGHALWSHRRWSTNVVLVAVNAPDRETCEQLRRARRDGVRVLTICPPPDGGWDRRLGEHLPIRPGSTGDLTEAMRDAAGRLQIQADQWPADWTRRQVAFPASPTLRGLLGSA
ncbi:MAG: hypothetical protein ACM3VU_00250 [Arthrospira platensis]